MYVEKNGNIRDFQIEFGKPPKNWTVHEHVELLDLSVKRLTDKKEKITK